MLFIITEIPLKVVSTDDRPIESFCVDLNFRKKKWLLNRSYNIKDSSIESHLHFLSESIDSLSSKYDNVILIGDFNSYKENSMKTFGEIYKLQNCIKEATCFKNPENPTCIDLMLTSKPLGSKNKRDKAISLSQNNSSCDENAFF